MSRRSREKHWRFKDRLQRRKSSQRRKSQCTFESLEKRNLLAVVEWALDTDGFWDVPENWVGGIVPGAGDDVVIDRGAANPVITVRDGQAVHSIHSSEALSIVGGSFTIDADSQFDSSLTLSGGTLDGGGNVVVSGSLDWIDGTMSGSGKTVLAAGSTNAISGDGSRVLGRTLENGGDLTSNTNGGSFFLAFGTGQAPDQAGVLTNLVGATFTVQGDGWFYLYLENAGNAFNNQGEFVHSGNGTTYVGIAFNNTGTIDVQEGGLELYHGGNLAGSNLGGDVNLVDGDYSLDLSGAGQLVVTGGVSIADGSRASNLGLAGGTLSSPGTLTVTDHFDWSNGEIAPTTTLVLPSGASGAFVGDGHTYSTLWGTLRNAGVFSVQSYLNVVGTAVAMGKIENLAGGTIELVDDATIATIVGTSVYGITEPGLVDNAGVLRHTGVGTSAVGVTFDNTGTIDVQEGGLELSEGGNLAGSSVGGDVNLARGEFTVDLSGAGRLVVAGNVTIADGSRASNLGLAGGTLSSPGTVTVTDHFDWSNGDIAPTTTLLLPSGASGVIVGNGWYSNLWGTLRNAGALSVKQHFYVGQTTATVGTIENLAGGTIELVDGATIIGETDGSFSAIGPGLFDNAGVLRQTGAATGSLQVTFQNTGTIDVQEGALELYGAGNLAGSSVGGDVRLAGGDFTVDLSGAGRLVVAGDVTIADGGSASNLALAGGTLSSPGTVTVTGHLDWSGGDITPMTTLVLPSGASGVIGDYGSSVLWGTLRNAGALSVQHVLYVMRTATTVGAIENLAGGMIELVDDALIIGSTGGAFSAIGPGLVDNAGVFRHTGAATGSLQVTFQNTGTIDVQAGTLELYDGGNLAGSSVGGDINLAKGDYTVDLSGAGRLVVTWDVTIAGGSRASNLALEAGTLSSPGTVTVTDHFDWSSGAIAPTTTLELSSGASGVINGPCELWGTLRNAGALSVQQTLFVLQTAESVGTIENLVGGVIEMVDEAGFSYYFGGSFDATGPGQVENAGVFRHTRSGISNIEAAFNNTGALQVLAGVLAINDGSAIFDENSSLVLRPAATLEIAGNLAGSIQQVAKFVPQGTIVLDGASSFEAPELFEVMSRDLGRSADGFAKNFAYGTIALGASSYVRFVDDANNAAGAEAEALYANALIVPAGATLDLNGLHVYARGAQLDGQIVNGEVSVLPDGGPIALDTPTVGEISAVDETDDWTFFGRAGRSVSIVVVADSGVSPAPPAPAIGYVNVEVEGLSGQRLATASNVAYGDTVVLVGIELPADGVYHVLIKAPSAEPGSTGYYNLTVADATVHTAPLTVNQTETGQLANQYSLDRWTFAATAGEIVQFKLLAAASSDIEFDLTSSDGTVAFRDLNAGTDPFVLPSSGTWTLTAHTIGEPGGYAFQLLQLSVTQLELNSPYAGTISASGQAELFSFTTTGSNPVAVRLADANHQDHNEVYVRLGSPPTRNTYDYRFGSLASASQDVLFSSKAGTYYVLVYHDLVAAPGEFTLDVESAPFIVTSTSPGRIGSAYDSTLLLAGVFPTSTSSGGALPLTNVFVIDHPGGIVSDSQWTFAAVAGQPVHISWEPYLAPDAWFTVTGPNDYVADDYVVTSGGWFELPSSGIYVIDANNIPAYGFTVQAKSVPVLATHPTVQFIAPDGTVYPANPLPLELVSDPTYLATHDTSQLVSLEGVVTAGVAVPANTLPPGLYSVRITDAAGYSKTLSNALTVVEGGIGVLKTKLIVPNPIGNHISATLYVQYTNVGDAPMAAPLLVLSASRPSGTSVFLTLDSSLQTAGFWTSAIPDGFSSSVQFLASGSIPGILQPHESVTVPVYYGGWLPEEWFTNPITFHLGALTDESTQPVDWGQLKDGLKPAPLTQAAWDALYPNLAAQIGATWGDYVKKLSADAQYLHRLGEKVTDVSQLFAFEVEQAAGFTPLSALASATDARVAAPGLGLSFGRTFQPSLVSRNLFGRFGWGWTDSWDTSLVVDDDGSVSVRGPGGSLRRFQPDLRGGFFAAAGDHGILAIVPDGYAITELDGQVTVYNLDGTLKYVEDANGNRITAAYAGGRLVTLTHSSGQSLALAYNSAGLVSSITDSAGRVTTYAYDSNKQYLLSVTAFDGQTTSYAYDTGASLQTAHALISVTHSDGTHNFFSYDAQGRLADAQQDGGANDTTFSYFEGQVVVSDALNDQAIYSFDHRAMLVSVQNPLGNGVQFAYDRDLNLVQMIDAGGQVYKNTYDSLGNLLSSTDPLGNTVRYSYSANHNRLDSATDAKGNATSYGYDGQGNLTSTTYADGTVENVAYDPIGNVINVTNRRGQAILYAYDAAGNVLSKTFPDGTQAIFTYDAHENLTAATDPSGTITLDYNAGDRLIQITYPSGRYLHYSYDVAGRRTQMVDQDGFTVNYSYDSLGRLATLTDSAGSLVVRYSYDAVGRLSREDKGNGTYATYEYDAASELLHLINYAPDGSINSRFDYTYDVFGRRISEATIDGDWTYSYDATGQLTHAVFASTNPAIADQDLAYFYDAAGNRTQTVINGVTTTYTTNNLNEYTIVGDATYGYDADGNMVSQQDASETAMFAYSADNRLTTVAAPTGSWTYQFNAFGDRTGLSKNGLRTEYLVDVTGFSNIFAEYNGEGNRQMSYVNGLGLVASLNTSGWHFYDFDVSGSTAGLTDAGGSYVNRYSFDPFGQSLSAVTQIDNPFEYVGQFGVVDDGNGLLQMRARYFDTTIGRFLAMDPIGLHGGDLNTFRYAGNNPVNLIDPSGLADIPAGAYGTVGLSWPTSTNPGSPGGSTFSPPQVMVGGGVGSAQGSVTYGDYLNAKKQYDSPRTASPVPAGHTPAQEHFEPDANSPLDPRNWNPPPSPSPTPRPRPHRPPGPVSPPPKPPLPPRTPTGPDVPTTPVQSVDPNALYGQG